MRTSTQKQRRHRVIVLTLAGREGEPTRNQPMLPARSGSAVRNNAKRIACAFKVADKVKPEVHVANPSSSEINRQAVKNPTDAVARCENPLNKVTLRKL